MNWIANFVRPKIRALVNREVPENLWHKCPSCAQMIFHRELEAKNRVCPHCGHHMRIGARQRLSLLFDDGQFNLIELPETPVDPLKFRDRKRYSERLREAQSKGDNKEAILVAHGKLGGMPVVIASFDFSFMGGSMGEVVGEKIALACDIARVERLPLVIFTSSGGARVHEGVLSLMQMAKTSAALADLHDAGGVSICGMTHPTTGGVTAAFASVCDFTLAEPGALIGFAGPRVIANTIKQELPPGFQRSEFLLAKGQLDRIVHRDAMRAELARLIDFSAGCWG